MRTARARRTSLPSTFIESIESRTLFAGGGLDLSFSGDGKQTVVFGGVTVTARDVAVQDDGKTIIVGQSSKGEFAIARLNLDGSLDNTFGGNRDGLVRLRVGSSDRPSGANAVAIQNDGKIVVVGKAWADEVTSNEYQFGILRLNTDGTPDRTFDGDGMRQVDMNSIFDSWANDVTIQSDGKIVVVGKNTPSGPFTNPSPQFAVVRFNATGSLDSSFDGDGIRYIDFGGLDAATAVAIDYNGTAATNPYYGFLMIAGVVENNGLNSAGLVRLSTVGKTTSGFGGNGKVTLAFPGVNTYISGIHVQPGGKSVLVGQRSAQPGGNDFFLARFGNTGTLDTTFGSKGTGYDMTDMGGDDKAYGIIKNYAGDGLLVGGMSGSSFAIAQYTTDGKLDTNFGTGGKVKTSIGSGEARIAAGPGRRFVMAGTNFSAARYLQAGANVVYATAFLDPQAAEAGANQGSFYVFRSERLPTETRVYFNIGGSAISPFYGKPGLNDYTLSGISIKNIGNIPMAVIPANQTYVQVFVTPVDDTRAEGSETATFDVKPNAAYEVGTPQSASIFIADNDSVALTATADAYVRDGVNANTNYGTSSVIEVKKSGVDNTRRGYIKFDLTGTSAINVAKLRLYGGLSINEGAGVATDVFGVTTTTWTESGINWNNRPETGSTFLSRTTIIDNAKRFYEWDVTAFVKAQKAAGKTSVTLYLLNQTSSTAVGVFDSRQGTNKPQLIVG